MSQPLFQLSHHRVPHGEIRGETIESVLAQTRDDWELIVVDNGNSDEMAHIVEQYTSDSRITLVRQVNKGVRGGVTAVLDIATGRYLCLVDSDDVLEPNFCEKIAAVIEADPEVHAVGCDVVLFTDFGASLPNSTSTLSARERCRYPSRAMSLADMPR